MLDLYHSEPNVYFLKPLIALEEAQVPFTSHYFDPASFEHYSPRFPQNTESTLQLEREGPVLVDGGTILSSSFFILEYIAEANPGAHLLPADPLGRYRARAWGQFNALQLAPGVCALGCAKYLAPTLKALDQEQLRARIERLEPKERRAAWAAVIDGSYDEPTLAKIRERLEMPVKRIESTLTERRWLAGDAYSIADIDVFALLAPLPDLAPELVGERATPRITEFLRAVRARPAVTRALAHARTPNPQRAFIPGAEPSRWG
jgi:glutathione S-transferase